MSGAITVAGFAASTKTPGSFIAVVLGGPGTSAGAAPIAELHVGNMIGTAITGAAPAFTVPAGNASLNVVVPVYSAADAASKFGAGSELHLMALAAFAHDPAATIYALPTAQGSTASTGVLTFTMASGSNPTASGVVRYVVGGQFVDVPFTTADTVTSLATNGATAINQQTNWPVTAQFASGVLTYTAKHTGLRSTNINVRGYLIVGTASSFVGSIAGSLVPASLGNIVATLTTTTATGGLAFLAGGTTEESMTTPLGVIAALRYNRIALAQQGATPVGAVMAQVNDQAGPTKGIRQQVVVGSLAAPATANTLAAGQNLARLQVINHYNADWSTGQIAAAVVAARVAGDGNLGGIRRGEAAIPSANLDGVNLLIPAQFATADIAIPTQIETSLNHGVTILGVRGTTGYTYLTRSITTACLDASGNPNFAVIDTEYVTVGDWVADSLQSAYAIDYAAFNVAADDPTGAPPTIPFLTTPSLTRSWVLKYLNDYQNQGILQQVLALQSLLAVALDTTPGRLLADIPFKPVDNLHQLAANVRQVS